ncbi:MAG TPA: tRNA 2-thiouridine(34) synthase MnmA [bacterium]|jgi:tRNA-specific 2-thiouridylase|nr:tRNA 2-thiouridine(34) synthase MnmA [bacterium]HOX85440.1 tRNA 2-thiouridine(34) synthase MnmA [bacterium]HPG44599.1 tRNA 2-thiouridine(34) synthase MnmA [bacterium]HPM97157.1 tRNA 2-thiouridine(34) synthase MnmA [bacterium]
MKKSQKIVAVAMSGGVDSSVAALLLQRQGYQVIGVTMLQMDPCQKQEQIRQDAIRVSAELKIDLYLVDMRIDFKREIIDPFLQEYLGGKTPNPCVHCNQKIKWGLLMEHGLSRGADFFATGHYARIRQDPNSKRFLLCKALDRQKDQSYALWELTQPQLEKTLLPLGCFHKEEVRKLAAELGLSSAGKHDSQEICFIEDDDYQQFIRKTVTSIEPGEIIDRSGKVIGRHRGYPFYTIGQRKGLGIALGHAAYVVDIDPQRNRIQIGDRADLLSDGLVAEKTNWISLPQPPVGMKVNVRIRYKDPGFAATIEAFEEDRIAIRFDQPRAAVTPGQSAVFFVDDCVLGGGIIVQAIHNRAISDSMSNGAGQF